VIFAHGFGLADIDKMTPATPDTRLFIGSATKAFAAMVVGMLVDEGAWIGTIRLRRLGRSVRRVRVDRGASATHLKRGTIGLRPVDTGATTQVRETSSRLPAQRRRSAKVQPSKLTFAEYLRE
jgi:hypothetical protein